MVGAVSHQFVYELSKGKSFTWLIDKIHHHMYCKRPIGERSFLR